MTFNVSLNMLRHFMFPKEILLLAKKYILKKAQKKESATRVANFLVKSVLPYEV